MIYYTLRRAYNLDVNIPDMAKKLLKDAFRLKRNDVTHLTAPNFNRGTWCKLAFRSQRRA